MSDENEVQIATIARHLRGLGLTEEQIQSHVAPSKAKAGSATAKTRALQHPKDLFIPPHAKGFFREVVITASARRQRQSARVGLDCLGLRPRRWFFLMRYGLLGRAPPK